LQQQYETEKLCVKRFGTACFNHVKFCADMTSVYIHIKLYILLLLFIYTGSVFGKSDYHKTE